MEILIFTPTWMRADGVDAMRPETRISIEGQQIGCPWTWLVNYDNPYPIGDLRNVLHQYQQAQVAVLERGSDVLITIEHDHELPDAGALQRMIDTPGDVIYAPYWLRHDTRQINLYQRSGWHALGQSLTVYPDELAEARQATTWPVSGAGFGCTLFRRPVLEAIPFEASTAENFSPDLGFAEHALRRRYESVARMDVPVAHRWRGSWWDPWGHRLTDPDRSDLIDGQWQIDYWLGHEQYLCVQCQWDTLRGLEAARARALNCARCHPPIDAAEPSPILVADRWGRISKS